MALQNKMIIKCQLVEQAVMEWFAQHADVNTVPARELMDFFVEKKIFGANKNKGAEVTNLLNRLYYGNNIQLVPHAFSESRGMGMAWFFQRLAGDSVAQDSGIKRTQLIEDAVKEWFSENPSETKVVARNLMDFFVKKKIFETNKNNGIEVANLLHRFNNGNLLHLLPHALLESKGQGSQWFFQRLASDGAPRGWEVRKYSPEVERYRSSLLAGYKD